MLISLVSVVLNKRRKERILHLNIICEINLNFLFCLNFKLYYLCKTIGINSAGRGEQAFGK